MTIFLIGFLTGILYGIWADKCEIKGYKYWLGVTLWVWYYIFGVMTAKGIFN